MRYIQSAFLFAGVVLALGLASRVLATEPNLRVIEKPGAITVEASDPEGLESLEVTCRSLDLRYHTQLPHSAGDRQFVRTFTLPELFPTVPEGEDPLRIEVQVRNTRGAAATATVVVQPIHTKTKRQ